MKTILATISALILGLTATAQSEIDVLRYSYITGGGTARYMSMGGAFGALGADMSSASTNPAGLARYSKSELVFTPGYHYAENNSLYNGNTAYATNSTLNITNAGYVGTLVNEKPDMTRWKTVQFGIVYNKLHNFNYNTTIKGSDPSSISHMMANYANGRSTDFNIENDPFGSGLFLLGEVIYEDENNPNTYYSYIETDVNQTKTINRRGSLGETTISFSGNYDDMLYVGGSVGIQRLRYTQEDSHYEDIIDQSQSLIKDLTYNETFTVDGTGFNLKLGAIYLPTQWLRLGVAYHTATIVNISDNYKATLISNDTIFTTPLEVGIEGGFDYKVRTPSRTIISVAGVIAKRAILSLDYEVADISKAWLKADMDNVFDFENEMVRNTFQSVNTIRLGAEYKLNDAWVVRAGFANFSSPIKQDFTIANPSRQTYSFGIGYRTKNFFWDVAFANTTWSEDYYLYDPNLVNVSTTNYNQLQFLNTFGFRF
jgi:hypothetical protein